MDKMAFSVVLCKNCLRKNSTILIDGVAEGLQGHSNTGHSCVSMCL